MNIEVKCPECANPTSVSLLDFLGQITCKKCGWAASAREFLEKSAKKFPDQAPAGASRDGDRVVETGAAERPMETSLRIENMPGYRFYARVPPSGFSFGAVPQIFFTLIWCGFMVMWNAIAIRDREWAMAGFGVIHDAVAVGLLLGVIWRFVGVTEIVAEYGRITRTRKLLGIPMRKIVETSLVKDVELRMVRRSRGASFPVLMLMTEKRPIPLLKNRDMDEMRWLASELKTWLHPAR